MAVFASFTAADSCTSVAGLFRLLELTVLLLSLTTSRRRKDRTPRMKASSGNDGAGVDG